MPKLAFINYRRADTQFAGHALYAQLSGKLGRNQVFMDVSSISPSTSWPERIKEQLGKAAVMLVVIGPG